MCGRYAATANPGELVEEFEISFIDEEMDQVATARYNIAPTDRVPAVVERLDGDAVTRKLVALRWGLVPSWAKAPTTTMINARVETVTEKPSFRKAASARRCLLPAIGYYEWRAEAPAEGGRAIKQPYFLHPGEGSLAMAGLYEFWKGPDGWLASTTIITTQATDEFGWVHDRMPMTVRRDDWADWLDPTLTDARVAVSLLHPPSLARPRKVSRAVSTVGNDGPALIEPEPGE